MTISPQLIAATIQGDPSLAKEVEDLVSTYPDTAAVMTRLLTYFQTNQASPIRPKIDQGITQYFNANNNGSNSSAKPFPAATLESIGPAIYSTGPLSFMHPVRKKLILSLHQQELALTTCTNQPELLYCAHYKYLYRVAAVPFLERTTKHTALILFFRCHGPNSVSPKDAIWAVPLSDDGKEFSLEFHSQHKHLAGLTDDLRLPGAKPTPIPLALTKRPDHILTSILSFFTQKYNPTRFSSEKNSGCSVDFIPNPTPAYPNFSAHLKSNQGTIYLLPTGILFAFKKPILFLRSLAIESIGVFSVMSRTFDFEVVMDVSVCTPEDLEGVPADNKSEARRAVGFGMVDTKEFGRLEEWIKKSGIRDRSLSEDLKAKDKAPTSISSSKKRERTADGGDLSDTGSQGSSSQHSGISASKKKKQEVDDDDDDDEEDQDFAPESEDEIMEEYDSEAEGSSGNDSENEDDTKTKSPVKITKKSRPADDEEDLEEESLGEDTDEDEEDEEDDEELEEEEDEEEEEEEEEDEVQEEPRPNQNRANVTIADEDVEEEEEEEEEEETFKTSRHQSNGDEEEEIDELIDDE